MLKEKLKLNQLNSEVMELEKFVKEFTEFAELETEYSPDEPLSEYEEWDSMAAMMMIGYISQNYSITMTGDELENLASYSAIFEHIASKLD